MVCQKIDNNIKKSSTLMGLVVTLVVVMAIFTIMFSWFSENASQSGVIVKSEYTDSYNRIIEQQGNLNTTVTKIQGNLNEVEEADNVIQVAWNGMKFLASAILSSKDFAGITIGTFSAVMDIGSDVGIISNIFVLATIVLIAFIVFLILANLKGEPKMIN